MSKLEPLALFPRHGGHGLLDFGSGQDVDVTDRHAQQPLPPIAVETKRRGIGVDDPSIPGIGQQYHLGVVGELTAVGLLAFP